MQPIILIDSGIGGLTVLKSLLPLMPNENFIYFADQKYCPYGNRKDNYLIIRLCKIAQFINHYNPKLVIIACNTASRFKWTVEKFLTCPVLDVITPTVWYVSKVLKAKNVLILATKSTAKGGAYQTLFAKENVFAKALPCSEFVEKIENMQIYQNEFYRLVDNKLRLTNLQSYDTIIYGCTHFGFADKIFRQFFNENKNIVECGNCVAEFIKSNKYNAILPHQNFANSQQIQILTTGDCKKLIKQLDFYSLKYSQISNVELSENC